MWSVLVVERTFGYDRHVARPFSDHQRAHKLLEAGLSQAGTARVTGIPRSTIRTWLERGPEWAAAGSSSPCPPCPNIERVTSLPAYAYLLGLYLGDGYICAHHRGVYRLRVTLDGRYPDIISACSIAMGQVLPNKVTSVTRAGCVEVSSYSKHWPSPSNLGRDERTSSCTRVSCFED